MSRWIDGTAYLQIKYRSWQLRVIKVTQREPEVVEPGCVVVKIKLRIPDTVFAPLQPEAVVTVPEELVRRPIQVVATDPGGAR